MNMRSTILSLALLSLSGCAGWMGPVFYGRNEAVNPFPPGRYRVQSDIGDKEEMVVRWDGHHLLEDGQESRNMDSDLRNLTLVPLVVAGRQIFIVQSRMVDRDDVAFYGLLERMDARYRADMPNCGATREIALAAGAQLQPMEAALGQGGAAQQPEEGSNHSSATDLCIFPNRASLEAALRRYIMDRRLSGTLIERIGD
jgi:hypothetical protein